MNARIAVVVVLAASFFVGCTCARSGIANNQQQGDATIRRDGFFEIGTSGDGQLVIGDGEICNSTGGGQATREPATIMFVVDTSGSMNCSPGTSNAQCQTQQSQFYTCLNANMPRAQCEALNPSARWLAFRPAFTNAITTGIPDGHFVGMIKYPIMPQGQQQQPLPICPPSPLVMIGPAASGRQAVTQQTQALIPNGPTPTSAAVIAAINQLRGSSATQSKYLVLSTDGAATCPQSCASCGSDPIAANDPDTVNLIASVRNAAANDRIRTFVIAVPGSEAWVPVLSEIASAGNGRFFNLNQSTTTLAADLANAFGEITNSTISCSYTIPQNSGTFDVGNVNVRYTDANGNARLIPRATASSRNGWDYNTPNNPTSIELVGQTCTDLRMAEGRVDVLFGCPTVLQ